MLPVFFILKVRYRLQFEEVLYVLVVDDGLYICIGTFAGTDVVVEGSVCEAEVVLITLTTEAICRSLLY